MGQILAGLMDPTNYTVGRLGDLVSRGFGASPSGLWAAVLTGTTSATLRIVLPVLAGLAAGDLAGSPIARWGLIGGLLGLLDLMVSLRVRKSDRLHTDMLALVGTMVRPDEVRTLAALVRSRWRLALNMASGAVTGGLALGAFVLVAPSAFAELPAGSKVLLGILAYELGEFAYLYIGFMPAFLAQLARSEHRLFWLNPVQSEPVQRTLHSAGVNLGFVGLAVTEYIALSIYLVSLDSALLIPVAGIFTVVGYVAVGVCLVTMRQAVRTIATQVRARHLRVLEHRIEAFGERLGSLTPAENDELRHLVETYRVVGEVPTSPSTSETVGHAAKALLIPTLGFLLAVMSEVYAERFLDQLLP
jgi:hypothetical protein